MSKPPQPPHIHPTVEQFLKLPKPLYTCPKYKHVDSSRYPDTSVMFDAQVKLPGETHYAKRTVVVYRNHEEALSFNDFLDTTCHPCLLRPIERDYRCCEQGSGGMAAHIYDILPDKLSDWVERLQPDLWEMDKNGFRIVSVSDRFRSLYKSIISYFKALHDARSYHGKGLQDLYITADLQIKVVNIPNIKLDDEDSLYEHICEDLNDIGRIIFGIIDKSDQPGLGLPISVLLYFEQFAFLAACQKKSQFRLLFEVIYMPPMIFNSGERVRTVKMAWKYKKSITKKRWEELFISILHPESGRPLFNNRWTRAILRLDNGDVKKTLLNTLNRGDDKISDRPYEYEFGILTFHRNFLAHHTLYKVSSPSSEAENLLFELWPDAIPMICYGLLCMDFGRNLSVKTAHLFEKPNILELIEENLLTFDQVLNGE